MPLTLGLPGHERACRTRIASLEHSAGVRSRCRVKSGAAGCLKRSASSASHANLIGSLDRVIARLHASFIASTRVNRTVPRQLRPPLRQPFDPHLRPPCPQPLLSPNPPPANPPRHLRQSPVTSSAQSS